MKKRFSLLLAIVMVIAMVLPMLPMLSVPTVAAEVGSDVIAQITGSDGTVKHTMTSGKFEDFSAKAVDGDTVTLYKDITTSGNSNFYGTITFDGQVIATVKPGEWHNVTVNYWIGYYGFSADVYIDGYKVYPFMFGPSAPFASGVDICR